ncbi:MAG: hypothetical protein WAN39_02475 [Candidatus Cybelea sp.]
MSNAHRVVDSRGVLSDDSTSILKRLTKDVTIGSTVDLKNGDMGPRAISVVMTNFGKLKKNQILVCNFDDKNGNAGKGTTIEQFPPTPHSKPTTFVQSSQIEGCDGTALTTGDTVYATGMTSKSMAAINASGKIKKVYTKPFTMPIADSEAPQLYADYSAEYIFAGNGDTGAVDNLSLDAYGTGKPLEVISGFPVNKGSGWSAQGPSGFAYWCDALPGAPKCKVTHGTADTLYIADGDCNAVVAIDHASSLLVKDEITVGAACKTFKCLYPSSSCGKVVKIGSPLNKPFAAAILPNGNMVVANTANNTLVELMPSGKVLDTKVVDKSKTPGIWSLFAVGTNDGNTAMYYTDTNSNELHKLEQ